MLFVGALGTTSYYRPVLAIYSLQGPWDFFSKQIRSTLLQTTACGFNKAIGFRLIIYRLRGNFRVRAYQGLLLSL